MASNIAPNPTKIMVTIATTSPMMAITPEIMKYVLILFSDRVSAALSPVNWGN